MSTNHAAELVDLIGCSHELTTTVSSDYTAAEWGNDLPVLATPILLWLSELAAMEVTDGRLGRDLISLGLSHDSAHLAPTPAGEEVTLRATLIAVGANKLSYRVRAHDRGGTVLEGTHVRGIVAHSTFTTNLDQRRAS